MIISDAILPLLVNIRVLENCELTPREPVQIIFRSFEFVSKVCVPINKKRLPPSRPYGTAPAPVGWEEIADLTHAQQAFAQAAQTGFRGRVTDHGGGPAEGEAGRADSSREESAAADGEDQV